MSGRRVKSNLKHDVGQSIIELAIILPVLLAIVVGIFEFGRAWNVRQVTTNAAREGARLAVIPTSTSSQVQTEVESRLSDAGLDPAGASITITGKGDGTGTHTTIQVDYPYTFTFLGPIVALLGGSSPGALTLSTTATMRNE